MAKQAQYQNRNKAFEAEGPKVKVSVLATKAPGKLFAHLGGYYKYDPNVGLNAHTRKGDMTHQSGFAFPADGKHHTYEFPQEFAQRLVVQAAELKDAFEVEILKEKADGKTSPQQFVSKAIPEAVTEPLEDDEDSEDEDLD